MTIELIARKVVGVEFNFNDAMTALEDAISFEYSRRIKNLAAPVIETATTDDAKKAFLYGMVLGVALIEEKGVMDGTLCIEVRKPLIMSLFNEIMHFIDEESEDFFDEQMKMIAKIEAQAIQALRAHKVLELLENFNEKS